MTFAILIGIDAITAAVILIFFITGLGDGTVSSYNGGLWAGVLAALTAIIGGGLWLRANGRLRQANMVFALLAIPAFCFGLFFLVLIISNPRWN
jgi:hypothetical protein